MNACKAGNSHYPSGHGCGVQFSGVRARSNNEMGTIKPLKLLVTWFHQGSVLLWGGCGGWSPWEHVLETLGLILACFMLWILVQSGSHCAPQADLLTPTVRTESGKDTSGVKWIHLTKKHLSTESAVTLSSIPRLSHNLSASVSLLENFE